MITSVVSDTTPPSRTRETLESALLNSPSPDSSVSSEKRSFSVDVDDDKKKKEKSQLPVVTYVAEPVDEKKTELPLLVESKGTETEEDDLIGTELEAKLEVANAAAADATTLIENDTTPQVEPEASEKAEEVDDSVIIIIQAAIRGFLVSSCFLLMLETFVRNLILIGVLLNCRQGENF